MGRVGPGPGIGRLGAEMAAFRLSVIGTGQGHGE